MSAPSGCWVRGQVPQALPQQTGGYITEINLQHGLNLGFNLYVSIFLNS